LEKGERVKKLSYLISPLFLVLLIGCAAEQASLQNPTPRDQADAPVWNVGDTWRMRIPSITEWEFAVKSIEGDVYIVEDRYGNDRPCFDKKTLLLKYFLTPAGKRVEADNFWYYGIYFDFPLYAGKQWGKVFSGTGATGAPTDYRHGFKVLSLEEIKVRAGTFKAFKIEFTKTAAMEPTQVITYHLWYSPEMKTVIKLKYIGHEGNWKPGSYDFELISFKLKDRQQKPSRAVPILDPTEKPSIDAPPPSAQKINTLIVTGTFTDIHSGAGSEFSIIATVKQGDKLILLGEYGDWFNVRLENGQEGWVHRRFVKE
jgi:hypothetical protein